MSEPALTEEELKTLGYLCARQLESGIWIAIGPLVYTFGLFYNVGRIGYDYRYCYESLPQAVLDFASWTGEGHPEGQWIKRKGGGDILNPNWARNAAGKVVSTG